MKKEKKKEKISYDVFSCRLHEGTKQKLIKKKQESGKSWNLFIYELVKNKQT